MPLSGPTVATAVADEVRGAMGRVLLAGGRGEQPDLATVQVAIARNMNLEAANWGGLFASASVSVLVAAVPFLFLQRYYARTIMFSGLK